LGLTFGCPVSLGRSFERAAAGVFVDVFTSRQPGRDGVGDPHPDRAGYASLFSALLNGAGLSYLSESGSPTLSFKSVVDASTTLSLTVLGFGGDPLTFIQTSGR